MKSKSGIAATCFIAINALLMLPQTAQSQNLTDVVNQTLKSNPEVLIDKHRKLSLEYTVEQAKGGYYPKVDLAVGIGREWSENISTRPGSDHLTRRESSLTLSQMLYDGYAVKNTVERNQSRVESAAHRLQSTAELIGLRTVEVYLEVLRRQALLELTQENLAAHERTYEQIKLRAESGVGRNADLEQAQARLSLSQANLAAAEANLREAGISFLKVTDMKAENLETVDKLCCDLFPATRDDAIGIAFATHPQLISAIAAYEAALAEERIAKAPFHPVVVLDLGTGWNDNLDGVDYRNNDAYAMVRMNYNLYRGGADQARVSETQFNSKEALATVESIKREIQESTRLSWNALETAQDRLPKQKMHVEATERTRDAYIRQFSIGQRTLLDLLDSENELYTARSNYINAQYDEHFARYRLMSDMGKLLDTLGVEPPAASLESSTE